MKTTGLIRGIYNCFNLFSFFSRTDAVFCTLNGITNVVNILDN